MASVVRRYWFQQCDATRSYSSLHPPGFRDGQKIRSNAIAIVSRRSDAGFCFSLSRCALFIIHVLNCLLTDGVCCRSNHMVALSVNRRNPRQTICPGSPSPVRAGNHLCNPAHCLPQGQQWCRWIVKYDACQLYSALTRLHATSPRRPEALVSHNNRHATRHETIGARCNRVVVSRYGRLMWQPRFTTCRHHFPYAKVCS